MSIDVSGEVSSPQLLQVLLHFAAVAVSIAIGAWFHVRESAKHDAKYKAARELENLLKRLSMARAFTEERLSKTYYPFDNRQGLIAMAILLFQLEGACKALGAKAVDENAEFCIQNMLPHILNQIKALTDERTSAIPKLVETSESREWTEKKKAG